MWFGIYLVQTGVIAPQQFVEAVELQLRSRPPIGQLAMEYGKLSVAQLFRVLSEQAESQQPFGQIAVRLRYLSEQDLALLLMVQLDRQRPLGDILVEMGAVEASDLRRELARFREYATAHEDWTRLALDGVDVHLKENPENEAAERDSLTASAL